MFVDFVCLIVIGSSYVIRLFLAESMVGKICWQIWLAEFSGEYFMDKNLVMNSAISTGLGSSGALWQIVFLHFINIFTYF